MNDKADTTATTPTAQMIGAKARLDMSRSEVWVLLHALAGKGVATEDERAARELRDTLGELTGMPAETIAAVYPMVADTLRSVS